MIVYGNRAQNYALQIFARTLNSDAFCIRTLHGSSGWQPWRKVILETGGDLTGDLSTTGSFTSYNIRGFRHQYSGIDRDVIPSSQQQIFPYTLLDKNGKTVSMYKVIQNTSGGIATQIGSVRSGDDGETEYALVEIGFDSEGVGYANVPSTPDDANNNRAATSKFVNDRISAHDATLVHTTGSETISGSKTFESPVVSKAVSLIQNTNWSGIRLNDTSRTSDSTKMLAQILDADGKRWIGLETTASTDGSRTVQLIGRNRDDTAWLNFIKFWERADGTYNVYLARNPVTESNDNSIATTAWSVGKTGNRGNLSGFETPVVQSSALTVTNTSRDTNLVTGAVKITVNDGAANQAWTKTVAISNGSATIALGSKWKWYGGAAPDVSANCVLVLHWCSTFGVASLIVTA